MKAMDDPPSCDLEETWRKLIAAGLLSRQSPECLVTALQDLGPTADRKIRTAIASRISDLIMQLLHKRVGKNHPNRGQDIIEKVHGDLINSLLDPSSSDGKAMRKAFFMILNYRIKDAIAFEYKNSRIPTSYVGNLSGKTPADSNKSTPHGNVETSDTTPSGAFHDLPIAVPPRSNERSNRESDSDTPDFESDDGVRNTWEVDDPSSLARFYDTEQMMDVERILSHVRDEKKRAAFRYHMDGARKIHIATVLDVDRKTIGTWISEVKEQLSELKEVKSLECTSRGANQ